MTQPNPNTQYLQQDVRQSMPELGEYARAASAAVDVERDRLTQEQHRQRRAFRMDALRAAAGVMSAGECRINGEEHDDLFALAERIEQWAARPVGEQPDGDTQARRALDVELGDNDSGTPTVRTYLVELLKGVWRDGEGFSGKRPFGNSGWRHDLYGPLIRAGLVEGVLDGDGHIEDIDYGVADDLIARAIVELGRKS